MARTKQTRRITHQLHPLAVKAPRFVAIEEEQLKPEEDKHAVLLEETQREEEERRHERIEQHVKTPMLYFDDTELDTLISDLVVERIARRSKRQRTN